VKALFVPAIHAYFQKQDEDARHKAGMTVEEAGTETNCQCSAPNRADADFGPNDDHQACRHHRVAARHRDRRRLVIWSGIGPIAYAIASVGWGILLVLAVRLVTVSVAGRAGSCSSPQKITYHSAPAYSFRFIREATNALLPFDAGRRRPHRGAPHHVPRHWRAASGRKASSSTS
jgi:hypothetical protein